MTTCRERGQDLKLRTNLRSVDQFTTHLVARNLRFRESHFPYLEYFLNLTIYDPHLRTIELYVVHILSRRMPQHLAKFSGAISSNSTFQHLEYFPHL